MTATGNETLSRIQREIQEDLEREKELRRKYGPCYNNFQEEDIGYPRSETSNSAPSSPEPSQSPTSHTMNGRLNTTSTRTPKFVAAPSSKGMMHRFLRMHGKLSMVSVKPQKEPQTVWVNDNFLEPAKVAKGAGKPSRNGYVSAEEKMRRELQEFKEREEELRSHRRKSQPDLMAALENEDNEESKMKLKGAMAYRQSLEDLTSEDSFITSGSLKSSRSILDLVDVPDEELLPQGTSKLIKQFENLKSQS